MDYFAIMGDEPKAENVFELYRNNLWRYESGNLQGQWLVYYISDCWGDEDYNHPENYIEVIEPTLKSALQESKYIKGYEIRYPIAIFHIGTMDEEALKHYIESCEDKYEDEVFYFCKDNIVTRGK